MNVIPRSKQRFHCHRCETNLCMDCARSRRAKTAQPSNRGNAQSSRSESSADRYLPMSQMRDRPPTQHVEVDGAIRRSHTTETNAEFSVGSASPEQGLGSMLPASALYPFTGESKATSSGAQETPSGQLTPRRHSTGGLAFVSPAPAPLCATSCHGSESGATLSDVQATLSGQSTPRRQSTGGLTFVPPPPKDTTQNRRFNSVGTMDLSTPSVFTPRATPSSHPFSPHSKRKSAFRQRSSKGTTIRVNIATTIEWIFLDESELVSELTRFSVPIRSDMQRDKWTRPPDQMHISWCPCGTSCAEHGGRIWCGHRGCPYSIFIPPALATPVGPLCAPQPFARCDSPVRPRSLAGDNISIAPLVQHQGRAQTLFGVAPMAAHAQPASMQARLPFGYYLTPQTPQSLHQWDQGAETIVPQTQLLMVR